MRRWWVALPLLAFAVLAGVLALGLRHDPREIPSPLLGRPAPAFALVLLDPASIPGGVSVASAGPAAARPYASAPDEGPTRRFSPADLRGRPWVLNVFASWCAGCRDEHPLLMAMARDAHVPLVGLDYKDRPEDARAWLAQAGNPYDVVAVDADGRVGIDYGVYGVPETFVVDRDGVVRWKQVGALTEAAWRAHVQPLLAAGR